jgi:hypothetical protein
MVPLSTFYCAGDRSEWTNIILVGIFKSKQSSSALCAPGLPTKEKVPKKSVQTKILPQPQPQVPTVATQPQQVFKKSEHLPAAPPQSHRERSPSTTPSYSPAVGVPIAAVNSKGPIPVPRTTPLYLHRLLRL